MTREKVVRYVTLQYTIKNNDHQSLAS